MCVVCTNSSEEVYLTPITLKHKCNPLYTGELSCASCKRTPGARRVYLSQNQECLFQMSSKTLFPGTGSVTATGKENSKQPRVLKTLCPWEQLYGEAFPKEFTIVYLMA